MHLHLSHTHTHPQPSHTPVASLAVSRDAAGLRHRALRHFTCQPAIAPCARHHRDQSRRAQSHRSPHRAVALTGHSAHAAMTSCHHMPRAFDIAPLHAAPSRVAPLRLASLRLASSRPASPRPASPFPASLRPKPSGRPQSRLHSALHSPSPTLHQHHTLASTTPSHPLQPRPA